MVGKDVPHDLTVTSRIDDGGSADSHLKPPEPAVRHESPQESRSLRSASIKSRRGRAMVRQDGGGSFRERGGFVGKRRFDSILENHLNQADRREQREDAGGALKDRQDQHVECVRGSHDLWPFVVCREWGGSRFDSDAERGHRGVSLNIEKTAPLDCGFLGIFANLQVLSVVSFDLS
jgi:hypothetical protein